MTMGIGSVKLKDIDRGDLIVFRCGVSEIVNHVQHDETLSRIYLNGYTGLNYRTELNGQFSCADPHLLDIIKIYKDYDSILRVKDHIEDLSKKINEVLQLTGVKKTV